MLNLNYKWAANDKEINGAFNVRREVFITEQGIHEDIELDGYDRSALHVVVIADEDRVIGTARVLSLPMNQAKIERMAILQSWRRKRIGMGIISFLVKELRSRRIQQVVLHAQYPAIAFYKSCGFKKSGSPFYEAGIKHIKMLKPL